MLSKTAHNHFTTAVDHGVATARSINLLTDKPSRQLLYNEIVGSAESLIPEFQRIAGAPEELRTFIRPANGLNAHVTNTSRGPAIVFDDSLIIYLLLWNRKFIIEYDSFVAAGSNENAWSFYANVAQPFTDTAAFFFTDGTNGRWIDPQREIPGEISTFEIALFSLYLQMAFITFHECRHLMELHLEQPMQDSVGYRPGHRQEIDADLFATERLLYTLSQCKDPRFLRLSYFALPLFFSSLAFAGELAAYATNSDSPILLGVSDQRLLATHPDTDLRMLIAQEQYDEFAVDAEAAPKTVLEAIRTWPTEGREQWSNVVRFSANCSAAVALGLVNVHGLFQTPVDVEIDNETKRRLLMRVSRFDEASSIPKNTA